MCHCCRAPSATDGPGQPPVTAARLAPASLHFFRHDGQLLDVWRFGSEVVCISPSGGGETLAVATAGGHVWVLPVPRRRYFVLPTHSARVNPTTPAGRDAGGGKSTGRKGKKGKAEAEEEERGEAPPRKKARTGAGSEEGAPQRKKGRPAALRDRSPEAFFASRTSPHLPLCLDRATHAPFLLVTLPRTDYVTDTPYGVLVSSPVVGVALYSAGTTRREHGDGGNAGAEEAEEWGRRVCAFPRLRGKKTTSVAIVVPYSSSSEDEQTSGEQSSNVLRLCRTLCTALFGQEATALNQPLVVHGDEDGSVRFVPLLVSTPSLSRPRLLFEMKESVENIAVSGSDMFLVTGRGGQVLVCLANDSAELESREFHVSMPITQSRVTDKYLLFASSRKLYASSLLERNEGETTFEHNSELDELDANSEQEDALVAVPRRKMPFSFFPHAFPIEGTIGCMDVVCVPDQAPTPTLLPIPSRKPGRRTPPRYRVTALSLAGKLLHFDMPGLRELDAQMQEMVSFEFKRGSQRVKQLLEDIDVLSTQQQAFDQEEAEINREIEAINNSIHLVSEHTFAKKKEDPAYRSRIPYAPDGALGIGCDVKLSVEPYTLSSAPSPHAVMMKITLANRTRFDLFPSHWSFVLTVRSRNAGGDTETCSHTFPIDQLHKGGAWSVRVPITIASFAPIHVDGLLCARFTPPRPSSGAPLGQGVCLSLCSRGFDIFHLFCPPSFGAKSKHSRAKATMGEEAQLSTNAQRTSFSITLQPPPRPSADPSSTQDTALLDLLSVLFGFGQQGEGNEGNEGKRVSSRTRASLVTFQGDAVSIRAKQATLSLRKVAINEASSLPAYVVTIYCASWLAPLLRAGLLGRVLAAQARGPQGSNASPERLQASVWARTYRDIALKKAQMLYQTLQTQVEGDLQRAVRDLQRLRDAQLPGSSGCHESVAEANDRLRDLAEQVKARYKALREHTDATLLL